MNALAALEKLKQGNARFLSNVRGAEPILSQVRRADFVHGQNPFAVILGCSDSRVPAEIIFDQGLGDLFLIRVAGNIVAPSQIGSAELARESSATPPAAGMSTSSTASRPHKSKLARNAPEQQLRHSIGRWWDSRALDTCRLLPRFTNCRRGGTHASHSLNRPYGFDYRDRAGGGVRGF